MKITHVVTRLARGGSERNLAFQLERELHHGHEVSVVVGGPRGEVALPEGVGVHQLPTLQREVNLADDARCAVTLGRLLSWLDVDVVHTHQSKSGIIGRGAARGRVPVVVHTVHMASFGEGYGRSSALFRSLEQLCARRTDLIVCVGEELRDDYLAGGVGTGDQYRVVRSAIEVERFLQLRTWSDERRRAARRTLGLPEDAVVMLACGALEVRKRHRRLIELLQPLLRGRNHVLAIAGEGGERDAILATARSLGVERRVVLLGHLADVTSAFGVADLFVHASLAEGVPQVVVQAAAAGVPVVATAVTGMQEAAGRTADIVADHGAELAQAVVRQRRPGRHVPVPPEHVMRWAPAAVTRQLDAFDAELRELVRDRTQQRTLVGA